jgi:hypothetical protein
VGSVGLSRDALTDAHGRRGGEPVTVLRGRETEVLRMRGQLSFASADASWKPSRLWTLLVLAAVLASARLVALVPGASAR